LGKDFSKTGTGRIVFEADDDRQDRHSRKDHLDKAYQDLDGMFVAVHRFIQYCAGKTVYEPQCGSCIDFGNAERCTETASGKD